MLDIEQAFADLRAEVAELRRRVDGSASAERPEPWDALAEKLKATMKQNGHQGAIGVQRAVVLLAGENNQNVIGSENSMSKVSDLPPDEKVIEICRVLSNPLTFAALSSLLRQVFEGETVACEKEKLAARLAVSADDLRAALAPAAALDIVRLTLATGEETWSLERPELVATLMTFA